MPAPQGKLQDLSTAMYLSGAVLQFRSLLPVAEVEHALCSTPWPEESSLIRGLQRGLQCWQGTIILGSLGGFEMRGKLRHPTLDEMKLFCTIGEI